MMFLWTLALAGRAPDALSEPMWVELDPLKPRMCVSMVPDAGGFKSRDAEGWTAVRAHLESGELSKAIATAAPLKSHPAQRTLMATAYVFGKGQAIDLDPIVERYPDDACLRVLASAVSLKTGDTAGVVRHVEAAYARWSEHPDVAELYALAGRTPAERKERFIAAVAKHPDDVSLRFMVAELAEKDDDLVTAVASYRRIFELGHEEVAPKLEKLALRAGDLDSYLRMAVSDTLPVKGPGFADSEDFGQSYIDWLGVESGQKLDVVFDTSMGELSCELLYKNAPITVMNFVGLARGEQQWARLGGDTDTPLYDGTIFHRVIPEFMIQGGDPEGTGRGGPGYRFQDEPSPVTNFDRAGLLAMANSGPDTNGSQFFITEQPTPHLSGKHTIFGACDAAAISTVRRIARVPATDSRPNTEVVIRSIRIEPR